MFWFRRRYCPIPFRWFFLLLGVKWFTSARMTEEDKSVYRDKARRFRSKFRDALAVWDEEEPAAHDSDSNS